jgi:hypothetical protein
VVCGEAVGLVRDRPSAANIVNSMVTEAAALLRNGGTLQFYITVGSAPKKVDLFAQLLRVTG